ncbi:DUF1801 domain-containing protein [Herbiconiux sp. CPCC 205763]|uniref:DUF1801 domain-containing protein n=1 Tax=Herbiconiux aconitum TaxID=2970913 RepID=A0ABT2GVY0_9MICO|nr:DUF1801 domain-containing protein [Herbiconiux aconitum]MCS5720365.1 DUF1801 domain-containing protein [Herbiconiux aconitum]
MTEQSDTSAPADPGVDALVAGLVSPREADIQRLRSIIRATDARITESVKWNSPSYALARTDGTAIDFATLNLRPGNTVRVVLHTGAKPDPAHPELVIDDPDGLLKWLGRNRAIVAFADTGALDARAEGFGAALRQWISQL